MEIDDFEININKIVSKIGTINENINIVDYIYHNNNFYFLYETNKIFFLIHYDIIKYRILVKYKLGFYFSGCFNKNFLYLIDKEFVKRFDLNNNKMDIYLNHNYMRDYNENILRCKKHALYFIQEKLYLCYNLVVEYNYGKHTLFIIDIYDNHKYSICNEYNYVYYFNDNNNIYIKNYDILYTFNINKKSFSSKYNPVKKSIFKISHNCCIINNELFNYSNNNIKMFKYTNDNLYNMYKFAPHESNNIINNLHFYNGCFLINTIASVSELNYSDINIKLCGDNNETIIPKNILIERSSFFREMFKDTENLNIDKMISINFPLYDTLHIYIKYITTNIINKNEFDKLFELCLFIDDCDLKHLANFIIYNCMTSKEINIDKQFYYLELLYTNNMVDEYYKLINTLFHYQFINGDEFINKLKNTKTNSDSLKFYIDTLEYIVKHKCYNNEIIV